MKYGAHVICAALLAIPLAGCYASSHFEPGDGYSDGVDVLADDGGGEAGDPVGDACMYHRAPAFEGLEYAENVQARTPFTLTIHHSLILMPTAEYELHASTVLVTLDGTVCECAVCPDVEPESVTTLEVEGLEPGSYTIEIQGELFPLHVLEDGCERYLLTPNMSSGEGSCPMEAAVGREVRIEFPAFGHSCGCGGYAETETAFAAESPVSPTAELHITAEEVICDPSQCCDTCRCVDEYDIAVPVSYPYEGLFYNYANGERLCFTYVFGEDGCSVWDPATASVADYTELVTLPPDGGTGDAVFELRMSSGLCCGGEAFVIEEREGSPDGETRIRLVPRLTMCMGDCCYMCACIDSYVAEHRIEDLPPGIYTVCVEGADCYEVQVIPLP